jgi:FixJ family two-component response regulator
MVSTSGLVLLVDDDAAVRNALKFAFEAEGLDVRAYGGGLELLDDRDLPAKGCLIVDYNMPVMNGIELVDVLRNRHVDLPVVLIAGEVSRELRARAAHSGIGKVLEKPLSDNALLDFLRLVLRSV